MMRPAALIPIALLLAGALYGFSRPADAGKTPQLVGYTITRSNAADAMLANPDPHAWHNLGGKITIGPGKWRISYRAELYADRLDPGMTHPQGQGDREGDTGEIVIYATLSTSPTGEIDKRLTSGADAGWNLLRLMIPVTGDQIVTAAKLTTFYLNASAHDFDYDNDITVVGFRGATSPTTITAERVG
jgi:hypothetical protein